MGHMLSLGKKSKKELNSDKSEGCGKTEGKGKHTENYLKKEGLQKWDGYISV